MATASSDAVMAASSATTWKEKGNVLYGEKKFDAAIECYSKAIEATETEDSSKVRHVAFGNRALAQMRKKKYDEALADCKQSLAVDPTYAKGHWRAGQCHEKLGDLKGALNAFKKCVDLNDNNPDAFEAVASAKSAVKRVQKKLIAEVRGDMNDREVFVAETATLRQLCRDARLKPFGRKIDLIQRILQVNFCGEDDEDSDAEEKEEDADEDDIGAEVMNAEATEKLLADCGIEYASSCLKAAIQRGHITVDPTKGPKQVLYQSKEGDDGCYTCKGKCTVTLESFAEQQTRCCKWDDGSDWRCGAKCNEPIDGCIGNFFVGACVGKPVIRGYKSNNHCYECPGFGKCIFDCMEWHCENCGTHYFQTSMGNDCDNCGDAEEDDCLNWDKLFEAISSGDPMKQMIAFSSMGIMPF